MKNFFNRLFGRHEPTSSKQPPVTEEPTNNQEPPVTEEPANLMNDEAASVIGPKPDERAVSLLDAIPDVVPIDLEKLKSEISDCSRLEAGKSGVLAFAEYGVVLDRWPNFNGRSKIKLSYTLADRKISNTIEILKFGSISCLSDPFPSIRDAKLTHVEEYQGQVLCHVSWTFWSHDGMTIENMDGREKADPLKFSETVVVVAYHAKKGVFEVRMPNSDSPLFLLRDLVERDLPGLVDRVPVC